MNKPFRNLNTCFLAALLLASPAFAQYTRQANLTIPDPEPLAAQSVALAGDGNTAAVGQSGGAVRLFLRVGDTWVQQGGKLVGLDASGQPPLPTQGPSVALSADGNTALKGAGWDAGKGAVWPFTRANGAWSQQGPKIVPNDSSVGANVGFAVALSANGDTALVGGPNDASNAGAAWVFTRNANGVWTQQGPKLTAADAVFTHDQASSGVQQGTCVALSADGNTALVGGPMDANGKGAAWIFTRANGAWTQQGPKLVGSDADASLPQQGRSCSLSSDGSTAVVLAARTDHTSLSAIWAFTRTNGVWTQEGNRLAAGGPISTVALAGHKNALIAASDIPYGANGFVGGTWLFTRSNFPGTNDGMWSLFGRIDDSGQEAPLAISADNHTVLAGGGSAGPGQVSVLTRTETPFAAPSPAVFPTSVSGSGSTLTFVFSDPQGFDKLGVVNVLINTALDGRNACYLAYSQPQNTLYLVADDGGTLLPGSVLTASGSTGNSQCTVSWGGSPVVAQGTFISLTLNIALKPGFTGNKVVFGAARDLVETNSGWQTVGVWLLPGAVPPTTTTSVNGMTPQSPFLGLPPSNTSAPFTFSFNDGNGFQDLGVVNMLAVSSPYIDGRHACYLAYDRRVNALYLVNDNGDALLPGRILNAASAAPLSNSQCSVTWDANPVFTGGNTLNLKLTIGFPSQNTQLFYLAARDATEANSTGWQASGIATWCKGQVCLGG